MTKKNQGVGLDIGTMNIVSARKAAKGNKTKRIRDAFLDLPKSARKRLKLTNVSYVIRGDELLILGDEALETANIFGQEPRRPLSGGLVSSSEVDALDVLKILVANVLGEPTHEGEHCFFSVPAAPVDQPDRDVIYHTGVFTRIVEDLGYTPHPSNEAMAVIFSDTAKENFSGLALSCLVPGTKIYTDRGIVPIEEVLVGDKVVTHKGRWRPVTAVLEKPFDGVRTSVQMQGYSDNPEDYQFVDNHELYVKREGAWSWIGCEEVVEGDIVGEPIVRRDRTVGRPSISYSYTKTSSKTLHKKTVRVTGDCQRLIGYFLGDGSVNLSENCIQFDFGAHEQTFVDDVKDILLKVFKKNSSEIVKSENCIRLKCYSKGLATYFSQKFYRDGEKHYPWCLSRLTRGDCANLLAGLVRSDGWVSKDVVYFGNSNTHIVWVAKQLYSRLGVAASISRRDPRESTIDGRVIRGVKDEWVVSSGSKSVYWDVKDMMNSLSCDNSKFAERIFVEDGFCCGRVQNLQSDIYEGTVYDLQVEEDHSFSGPFLTIHNCGAGMTNVALAVNTIEGLTFSVARGGDFIDAGAAKSVGSTKARITSVKEAGIDLLAPKNRDEEAIVFYYRNLISYVLKHVASEFKKIAGKFNLPRPIPIIVSGGTSQAGGFLDLFMQVFEEHKAKFPIQISEIRAASDPLNAVALGMLVQSIQEYEYEDEEEDDSDE